MYQKIIRPFLFALPPEMVHQSTLQLLRAAGKFRIVRNLLSNFYQPGKQTPVHLLGLEFPNQVGLAAGYDKDGEAVSGLAALGFGHIEVGTVTPYPQPGNPKPRIFRLPNDRAVINRMGFPGKGAVYVANQLSRLDKPAGLIIGVNIGKNKDTPLDDAAQDYLLLIEKFAPWQITWRLTSALRTLLVCASCSTKHTWAPCSASPQPNGINKKTNLEKISRCWSNLPQI